MSDAIEWPDSAAAIDNEYRRRIAKLKKRLPSPEVECALDSIEDRYHELGYLIHCAQRAKRPKMTPKNLASEMDDRVKWLEDQIRLATQAGKTCLAAQLRVEIDFDIELARYLFPWKDGQ